MSNYKILAESQNEDENVILQVKVSKKSNILSKAVNSLILTNNTYIQNNLTSTFQSGSNSSEVLKGLLVQRNYTNVGFEGSDYFIVMDNKINKDSEISFEVFDNDEESKNRNINSISSLRSLGDRLTISYEIDYFEIDTTKIIKSKVLLTDYLIREYYFNQGKNYSVTKMEKIVDALQKQESFDNSLEIDFYKSLTKASTFLDSINFLSNKKSEVYDTKINTFYLGEKFMFTFEVLNSIQTEVSVHYNKLFVINKESKQKTLVKEKFLPQFQSNIVKNNNLYYGSLFSRKIAQKYENDANNHYEVELRFDIYDTTRLNKLKSESKFIRL